MKYQKQEKDRQWDTLRLPSSSWHARSGQKNGRTSTEARQAMAAFFPHRRASSMSAVSNTQNPPTCSSPCRYPPSDMSICPPGRKHSDFALLIGFKPPANTLTPIDTLSSFSASIAWCITTDAHRLTLMFRLRFEATSIGVYQCISVCISGLDSSVFIRQRLGAADPKGLLGGSAVFNHGCTQIDTDVPVEF